MAEHFFCQSEKDLSAVSGIIREMLKTGAVDIEYRPHRRSKSQEQLGYYYGCVLPIIRRRLKQDGNDFSIDDVDFFLKTRFFSDEKFNPFTGKLEKIVRLKRASNVVEMSEYITKVIQFSTEILGLHIPASEDYIAMKEAGY